MGTVSAQIAVPSQPRRACCINKTTAAFSVRKIMATSGRTLPKGCPPGSVSCWAFIPRDPQTLFVMPEDEVLGTDVGGGIRYASGARFRVFRSRTGGQDWEPLTDGLPQEHAYIHVLREGMATDCSGAGGGIRWHGQRPDLLQQGRGRPLGIDGGKPAAHQFR